MGLRHRSIRLRVGILIAVPILCLIGLYGFAASITLGNALTQARAKSLRDQLLTPLTAFQTQIDTERHLAVLSLAEPKNPQAFGAMGNQEVSTGTALKALTQALRAPNVVGEASPRERQLMNKLLAATGTLNVLRSDVEMNAITIPEALQGYSAMVNDAYQVLQAATYQQVSVPLVTQALDVIGLDQVAQITVEESDLLAGDIARGQFPATDRTLFAQLAYSRASTLGDTMALLDPSYSTVFNAQVKPSLSASMAKFENDVVATPWARSGAPAQVTSGAGIFMTYTGTLDKAISKAAVQLENEASSNANSLFAELFLAGGLGLIGILASVILSLYIGRGLVQQLRGLRQSALSLANEKLPGVIQQLRDGQPVDLSGYVAPEATMTSDEIEQVEQAFGVVQQTAVQSAVDEARLRRGISDVFRNLAGRSQSLLHRQLTLLDGMERRATEPDELEDLFRIDHLTTRMRRHAEGLIILSGETPARAWRQPVPLIDVLRAAVAEVEDYTRVRVLSRTRAAVAGHAVADVIHLIAELAENATVFSPPNTPVRIQGDIVGRGFAVEIEDRGLGISPERLAEINARLASPPQFDLSDSDRLGLFIAGQLARRHDISVTLQPSVYGGTTAIVLIPMALVIDEDSYLPEPALPTGAQAGQLSGRHAALTSADFGPLAAGNGHGATFADAPTTQLSLGAGSAEELMAGTLLPGGFPPDNFGLRPPGDDLRPGSPGEDRRLSPTGQDGGREPVDFRLDQLGDELTLRPGLPRRQPGDNLPRRQPGDSRSLREPADEPPVLKLQLHPQADPQRDGSGPVGSDGQSGAGQAADLGLPTRVRQASLAPQLRASERSNPAMEPTQPVHSPEAARDTMSALQRGWVLGRAEAGTQLPDPPADPPRSEYDVFTRPEFDGQPSPDGDDETTN
jgi:signal transduction histidine kinase